MACRRPAQPMYPCAMSCGAKTYMPRAGLISTAHMARIAQVSSFQIQNGSTTTLQRYCLKKKLRYKDETPAHETSLHRFKLYQNYWQTAQNSRASTQGNKGVVEWSTDQIIQRNTKTSLFTQIKNLKEKVASMTNRGRKRSHLFYCFNYGSSFAVQAEIISSCPLPAFAQPASHMQLLNISPFFYYQGFPSLYTMKEKGEKITIFATCYG